MKIKTYNGHIIKRSSKYGVGKEIGGAIYVHKSAEDILPTKILNNAKTSLPKGFQYEIVKYDLKNGNITFIDSPDWNTSDEPIVGDAFLIRSDGTTKLMKQKASPQIYHHKWLFVRDDYSGFDVGESVERSKKWTSLPNIDYSRIGYKNFWDANVVPLIENRIKNIIKMVLMEYHDIEQSELERANKSSRRGGFVGTRAVTPKAVIEYIKTQGNENMSILDFGSGREAVQAQSLRDVGLNVTAHEFHSNINPEYHDPKALNRKYDIVYASNVLNVQGSEAMFRATIQDILKTMNSNSVFIANYPSSPRYYFQTAMEAKQVLEDYFIVDVFSGSDRSRTSVPIWIMRKK